MSEVGKNVEASVLERIPARLAVEYQVLPLGLDKDDTLVVAMAKPLRVELLDELSLLIGQAVRGEVAATKDIVEGIRTQYGIGASTLEDLVVSRNVSRVTEGGVESIDDATTDASIVRFVNELIVDAYNSRATDIHLEPFEHQIRVRYRIDGILFDAHIPETIRHFRDAIVSRVKIMADLDIAERRLPQDGRIRVRIDSKDFDLRVSVIPIAHGESVNVRILQRSNVLLGMDAVGFAPQLLEEFDQLLERSHGIILMTGPTGSGKTTTLYAALNKINQSDRKIITIEDPIEYEIPGICQMHARPGIGLTFAAGLRSMLRHDPDVMLVGEIRDFETAELAIRCALTGHLVFSTLHTNDAAGAMPRLADIGIEPYLLASSVQAVIAQRLVRSICTSCASPSLPSEDLLRQMAISPSTSDTYHCGLGCEECRQSGYFGRTAIHEMFLMDDDIRHLVIESSDGGVIKKAALSTGMRSLRDDGIEKARQGLTTLEEILRVTQEDR